MLPRSRSNNISSGEGNSPSRRESTSAKGSPSVTPTYGFKSTPEGKRKGSDALFSYQKQVSTQHSPRSLMTPPPTDSLYCAETSEGNKYRQLPCKTFISVGSCPYRDRCVYLHDPRLIYRDIKTKTRKRNHEDKSLDSFFWPAMSLTDVMKKLDSSKSQPHVVQAYNVPGRSQWKDHDSRFHDSAVCSMWTHFTEFCSNSQHGWTGFVTHTMTYLQQAGPSMFDSTCEFNPHANRNRLEVLVSLSNGIAPIAICKKEERSPSLDSSISVSHRPLFRESHSPRTVTDYNSDDSEGKGDRSGPIPGPLKLNVQQKNSTVPIAPPGLY